jgi:predicted P-loop ATPase
MPVFYGGQGVGKSEFMVLLAWGDIQGRKGYYSSLKSYASKEAVESMQGSWLVLVDEMAASNKADIEHQKAFITERHTNVRLAYRRDPIEVSRHTILIGSTNDTSFLKDKTGNRRYLPIHCKGFDRDPDFQGFSENTDQFWAEAMVWYKDMVAEAISQGRVNKSGMPSLPLMLSAEAQVEAKAQQKSVTVVDEWEGVVEAWLNSEEPVAGLDFEEEYIPADLDYICVSLVMRECLGITRHDRRDSNRMSQVLSSLDGWVKDGRKDVGPYGKQVAWRRIREF